ncbi:THUMP domain-containing protein 2 [Myripristis murdjan]|uniref:THUMP domain containing 2 n=1 Tax=Myripristis murdjan TaxID=586833 RepID=A0A668A7C9_9TELE|nr:THUMP domain-containing protein 2 [Myripristis murdjan]
MPNYMMTEPKAERSLVRYYCTAGNGMEPFLVEEVKTKLAAEHVYQMPGKVLFGTSAAIDTLTELKAAERLFLLLRHESPVNLTAHKSPAKVANALQSRLIGERSEWTSAVMTWSRLQGELAHRRIAVHAPSITRPPTSTRNKKKEEERVSEKETEEEERQDGESGKSSRQQTKEESGVDRQEEKSRDEKQSDSGQNETETSEKKRKREVEESEGEGEREREDEKSQQTCGAGESGSWISKRKRGDEEEERSVLGWACRSERQDGENDKTSEQETKREEEDGGAVVELSDCQPNGKPALKAAPDFFSCDHTTGKNRDVKREAGAGRNRTVREPSKDKPELSPPASVSFRISCKCTGALSRLLSTQELSRVIGVGLSRLLGWKADLRNPQLEVNVYLSDEHCLVGIPLTRVPLANRSYLQTTGLRSTIAWALGSLAHIQPGSRVVDPMCGVGTILIEAAQEHKHTSFLGVDIDDGQLQRASENVVFADLSNRIHLLKASSMELPLPSASVDAVVSDVPFGRKFGTKTHMAANLPLILTEMERILRVGGVLVLLLSPQLSCLLKKLQAHPGTGSTSSQETEAQTGPLDLQSALLSSVQQEPHQKHVGNKPSSSQEREPQTGPQHRPPPPLSSLRHQATHRVSLGAIDGLIHKYIKTET